MNDVNNNGETQREQQPEQHDGFYALRRPRGRPRGRTRRMQGEGSALKITGRPKSLAAHRKWQRDWVMPQFVVSRRQAQDMLLKYLRSKPGKVSLSKVIDEGFVGLSKLPDNKLAEFLVSTNLLSRYPHEIVIKGA
jgi:hypothetical protein